MSHGNENRTAYAVFLRGINVGGHKKIPMAELRCLLDEIGYNARTYIQSGNIVLSCDETPEVLTQRLESAIKDRFGFNVTVIVRSLTELSDIIESEPFDQNDLDPSKLGVVFLSTPLTQEVAAQLSIDKELPEQLVTRHRELLIYYPDGMGRSRLDRSGFWKPLAPYTTTTRNWRTVQKLHAMLMQE